MVKRKARMQHDNFLTVEANKTLLELGHQSKNSQQFVKNL